MFENRALRGHIVESCGSIKNFAKAFGLTEQAMQLKISNKTNWSRSDIITAVKILGIDGDPMECWRTFFSLESWEIANASNR